ncbi:hypothetical protein [African swine fever virus]
MIQISCIPLYTTFIFFS